ncbi:MAG: hypothetical protein ABIE70_13425 [bacterium]
MADEPTSPRVLLIAYYFPPLGGAGVGRPLALARYLPEYGIACDVLTVKPVAYHIHEPELLEGLDLRTIYRSGSYDPQRLLHLLGQRRSHGARTPELQRRARRIYPDTKRGWIGPAVRLGTRLLAQRHYDAIISTSPPISAHYVARRLARASGVKWLADFRDPWTSRRLEDWFLDPNLQARAWAFIREAKQTAAALIATNRSTADYLGCQHTIPNGYDPEVASQWQAPTDHSVLTIGLLGTIDSLTPIEPLATWLAELYKQVPQLCGRIKIAHVGRCDHLAQVQAVRAAAPNIDVACHGLKPRRETVALLNEAVVLYLGIDPDIGAGLTPGRFFDMLASGRRLLVSASANSDVAKIVGATGCGQVFDPQIKDDAAAIGFLQQTVQDWLKGDLTIECPPSYAAPYSYRQVAKRFADLIVGRPG